MSGINGENESFPCLEESESDPKQNCCMRCLSKCTNSLGQRFYSGKGFLVLFSFYIFFQSLVASGYTASVATSIEQRYSLKSTEIGAIVASCDIGSLSTVVFVSWVGGQGNRPRWVAAGGLFVAAGSGKKFVNIYILGDFL